MSHPTSQPTQTLMPRKISRNNRILLKLVSIYTLASALWCWWLGDRKGIQPVNTSSKTPKGCESHTLHSQAILE